MTEPYISPKVCVRKSRIGKGLFAIQKISKGEVITDSTNVSHEYVSRKEACDLPQEIQHYLLQVDEDLYSMIGEIGKPVDADFVNHSCDPNCGIKNTLQMVAMRDIQAGEEITYDYTMTDSWYGYTMKCECGSQNCRKRITGLDWYQRKLQKKYEGYFSDYIQKKIEWNFLHTQLMKKYERILKFIYKIHYLIKQQSRESYR